MLDDFMRANFFAEEIQYCVSVLKDRRDVNRFFQELKRNQVMLNEMRQQP